MANTRNVGLKITIDGEKEYKQSIAKLNRDNAVLASELKKVQEQYKGNEDSLEALTAKQRIYEEQLATQQRKVEETRTRYEAWQKKLEEVKTTFGASSDEYREAQRHVEDYRIKLNNAETAEIRMQRAVEENTRAIDAQGQEMDDQGEKLAGLGDAVSELAGKLGIQIPQAATDALNGMDKFSAGSVASMGIAAGAIGAVYKVGKELFDLTRAAAAEADALLTRSAQTGIDAETLQGLDYASNFLDFEGIDQSLVKLTTSMDKARDGAEKQAAAFAALGVSVTDADGQLKNNYDTFLEVIDALGEVENATERDAIANDLFGKSYSELKPLIDAGSQSLQDFMDKAKQTGIVLTEDQVKKLGEVDDAHQELQAQIEATKNKIAVEFAPATKAAMDTFSEAVRKGGDALTNSGIISGVGAAVQSVLSLVDAGARLVNSLPDWINPLENVSRQFEGLAIAASLVADAVDLVSGLMPWNWGSGQATTALGWNIDQGQMSHFQQYKYRDGIAYNAAGDMDWRGGLTWVGESGPELVSLPQGSAIYSNQESRQIAAAATDTSRIESLLERCLQRMDGIERELADGEAVRRMA